MSGSCQGDLYLDVVILRKLAIQLLIRYVVDVALEDGLAGAVAPDLSMLQVNEAWASFGCGHQPVCAHKRLGHNARLPQKHRLY